MDRPGNGDRVVDARVVARPMSAICATTVSVRSSEARVGQLRDAIRYPLSWVGMKPSGTSGKPTVGDDQSTT